MLLGPEFGKDRGHKAIVVRAPYDLKSAGPAFRNHLTANKNVVIHIP